MIELGKRKVSESAYDHNYQSNAVRSFSKKKLNLIVSYALCSDKISLEKSLCCKHALLAYLNSKVKTTISQRNFKQEMGKRFPVHIQNILNNIVL